MSRFLNNEEPNRHDRLSVRPSEAAELLGISPSSLDRLAEMKTYLASRFVVCDVFLQSL